MGSEMRSYHTFVFDIDGTLIRENELLPGAGEVLQYLQRRGKQVLLCTNSPVKTKKMIVEQLQRFNLDISSEQVLTPIDALHSYFTFQTEPVQILGLVHPVLVEEIKKMGWNIVGSSAENPTLEVTHLVLGMHDQFTYQHLKQGLSALDQGAVFLAWNADLYCPMAKGRIPDTGTLMTGLEKCSEKPAVPLGKPSIWMQKAIRQHMKDSTEGGLFIGDSPFTDMRIGHAMGMDTVLLGTGIQEFTTLYLEENPTFFLSNLQDILKTEEGVFLRP